MSIKNKILMGYKVSICIHIIFYNLKIGVVLFNILSVNCTKGLCLLKSVIIINYISC